MDLIEALRNVRPGSGDAICRDGWGEDGRWWTWSSSRVLINNRGESVFISMPEFQATDWQEWQEQREYFGFTEAMHGVLNGLTVGCEDFVNLDSIYLDPHGEMVAIKSNGNVENSWFELAAQTIKSKKWYIATPAPEPGNETNESTRLTPFQQMIKEPENKTTTSKCPNCEGLGVWHTDHFECVNEYCMEEWTITNSDGFGVPNPKIAPKPETPGEGTAEPVFDLTYEDAKAVAKIGAKVMNSRMQNGRYLLFMRDAWVNMEGTEISAAANGFPAIMWNVVE